MKQLPSKLKHNRGKKEIGIYCIVNTKTKKTVYVGASIDLYRKFYKYTSRRQVRYDAINGNREVAKYIMENGHEDLVFIWDKCETREVSWRVESMLIRTLKPLCNRNIGGYGTTKEKEQFLANES